MNICIVSNEYPPRLHQGGIGTQMRVLALAFTDHGHRVCVITRTEGDEEEGVQEQEGIKVFRIRPSRIQLRGLWRLEQMKSIRYTVQRIRYSLRVNAILQELKGLEKFDVIISPEWGAETLWYALFAKKAPLIVRLCGPSFLVDQFNGRHGTLDAKLVEWLECMLVRRADFIHAVGVNVADQVARRFKVPRDRIKVVYSPIDAERFKPGGHRKGNFGTESRNVLYVGRLERLKGVEYLVEAIKQVHSVDETVHFTFIGRDMPAGQGQRSTRAILERKLGASISRVTFTGPIPHVELVSHYQRSAVCVFPSLQDPMPNVCLEAMACGAAVVGTKGTGMAEVIEGGVNGVLVQPGDSGALADRILTLLSNDMARRRIGLRARETIVERYTKRTLIPQWLELLETALRGERNLKS